MRLAECTAAGPRGKGEARTGAAVGVPVLNATNHARVTNHSTTAAQMLTIPHVEAKLKILRDINSPASATMALQKEPWALKA